MGVLDINAGSKVILSLVESYSLNIQFNCDTVVGTGVQVTLKRDGTGVTPVLYGTDKPLGIVVSGNRNTTDRSQVTVQTKFSAVVRGYATQAMVVANEVAACGFDVTTGLTKYKKAVQGDYIVGVALTVASGDGDTTLIVGVYRQPYLETATVGS